MKLRYPLILLFIVATLGCSSNMQQVPVQTEQVLTTKPTLPSVAEIFQKLTLCANNEESTEEAAQFLSRGNNVAYQRILQTMQLYVSQQNYTDKATKSFSKYIRGTLVRQFEKQQN